MFSVIYEVISIATYNCQGTGSCRNHTWVCQVEDRSGLLPSVSSFPTHTLRCGWPRCSWPLSAEQSTSKCCAGKIPYNTQTFSHLWVNMLVFWNVHFRMTMKSINSFNNAAWSTGVDKHPTEVQEEAKIRIHKHSCRRHYIKFWKASFSLWPLSSLSPVKKAANIGWHEAKWVSKSVWKLWRKVLHIANRTSTVQPFYILAEAARLLYAKWAYGKVFHHKLIVTKLAKIFI